MSISHGLHPLALIRRFRPALLFVLLGASLAACGGGGDDDDGGGGNPPPGPPPPGGLPPLSQSPINIDDGRQIGTSNWGDGDTSTGGQGGNTGGLDCFASLSQAFHLHSHVAIFLNGTQLAVPHSVGLVDVAGPNECHYPIHTHDRSGMIHVENATSGTFTLGQLFAIWGQPLSSSDVAGLSGMPVVVYVTDNGTVTQASGNLGDIELRSHRLITIQVGTAITEIPNYTWTGN
jgi:hypothetical protein